MLHWLDGMAGPQYTRAILWTLAALVLLVVVLLVIRLIRGMTAGTYVAGGRSRKTRLSVMDATAVDSHRRLVLVRRDDVEHLLLIGGPTDVVVERDIRLVASRRPVLTGETTQPQHPRPAPPSAGSTTAPRPSAARPQAANQPTASRETAAAARPTPRYVPANEPVRTAPHPVHDPIDDALMNELEFSLDDEPVAGKPAARTPQPSLDDEMTKLLGELSIHKR
jgi:hypothetical protein